MEINELKKRAGLAQHKKLMNSYTQFDKLLTALRKKEISQEIITLINTDIDRINSILDSDNQLFKQIKKTQTSLLKRIEKEHQLVTIHHFRNTWLAVGMAVFGIPIGVSFGLSIGNMGLLAIGLPIGMVIGIAVGTSLDKKALEEGRQIDLEIKY